MPVTFSAQQDTLTAYLAGELDHHNAAAIREAVDEMVESSLPKSLVLDFEKVPFMDSSGNYVTTALANVEKDLLSGGDPAALLNSNRNLITRLISDALS